MAIDTLLTNAIGDDAITSAKLGASSVDSTALATNAVTSAKIGVDVIVAEDLAANSVTVSEITDGAISTAKIADNAVTSAKLAGGGLPRFHVIKSNSQNLSGNNGSSTPQTPQIVQFNEITNGNNNAINADGLFASNKFTVTASTTGIYYVYFQIFSDTTASQVFLSGYGGIYKNGNFHTRSEFIDMSNGTSGYIANGNKSCIISGSALVDLSSNGDYIEVRVTNVFNGSGTVGRISSASGRNFFGGFKLGSV